jgi:citronellol/citronellal dehydrogenase
MGMSMVALGLAGELRRDGIAVNALWPRTTIATSAIRYVVGEPLMRMSRTPEIMADAAHLILTKDSRAFTGNFVVDDTFLAEHGVTDFDKYRVDPTQRLQVDFFVPDDIPAPASLDKVR